MTDVTPRASLVCNTVDQIKTFPFAGQDTTTIVKETLHLHPPAATARLIPHDAEFEAEINHKPVRVDGLRVYPSQWLIHRNPAI
jgi:cytochrome P450